MFMSVLKDLDCVSLERGLLRSPCAQPLFFGLRSQRRSLMVWRAELFNALEYIRFVSTWFKRNAIL